MTEESKNLIYGVALFLFITIFYYFEKRSAKKKRDKKSYQRIKNIDQIGLCNKIYILH